MQEFQDRVLESLSSKGETMSSSALATTTSSSLTGATSSSANTQLQPQPSQQIDETNQVYPTMYRETGTRCGFWLEAAPSSQSPAVTRVPNPSAPNYDPTKLVWLEMVQDYDVEEPEAVTITPTQGGGKLIEDRGMIIKDIVISGTTGYTANPSMCDAYASDLIPHWPYHHPTKFSAWDNWTCVWWHQHITGEPGRRTTVRCLCSKTKTLHFAADTRRS